MRPTPPFLKKAVATAILVFLFTGLGNSYSVLTHEEVVDLLWKDEIQPLLLKRFPGATRDQLHQAHAYAYGGSVLQDMGYYPFGSKYFSDLVHYVRTGDFVNALIGQSSDINEYAFALGALAHYASDNTGHPTINRSVGIDFPKLRKKYGEEVTYADDPKTHIRTEFGFDMVQVAKNRYTSDSYHDFIGFEVSKPLMERAFLQTYGLKLSDVFGSEDLSIGTFRHAIATVIPQITRAALINRRQEIVHDTPNFNEKTFLYHLSRTTYKKQWGTTYRKPKLGARILAFFLKIVPKIGPFKALAFTIPTTQTEDMYIKSINATVDDYGSLLRDVDTGRIQLANLDCDTGHATRLGEYSLADTTYARLLDDLSKHQFADLTPGLWQNILDFYSGSKSPIVANKEKKAWEKTLSELEALKSVNEKRSTTKDTK
ncbi:MAG TPA: zinc dependent phospholipase C family protein [Terriglobales bacterium]|nr:zinc dependent phospholipase C family protein [Terriglobales bacterium]